MEEKKNLKKTSIYIMFMSALYKLWNIKVIWYSSVHKMPQLGFNTGNKQNNDLKNYYTYINYYCTLYLVSSLSTF